MGRFVRRGRVRAERDRYRCKTLLLEAQLATTRSHLNSTRDIARAVVDLTDRLFVAAAPALDDDTAMRVRMSLAIAESHLNPEGDSCPGTC